MYSVRKRGRAGAYPLRNQPRTYVHVTDEPKESPADNPFMAGGASSKGQSGQVAVEAAIVMPLMVFMVLGILQLTMVQHAKIMTEYAAYNAARAGIVWNGNNERMHDAAIMSLLPTMGRTDNLTEVGKTWAFHQLYDTALRNLPWPRPSFVPDAMNPSQLLGFIRVDTINPYYYGPIDSIWKLRDGLNWKELDFDGPDSYPEVPGLEQKIAKFFNLQTPDNQEEVYRRQTVLTIRVRYWYEMRVPFANWMIFLTWYASNAGVQLSGAIGSEQINYSPVSANASIVGGTGNKGALPFLARGIGHQKGYNTAYRPEMVILWGLATGQIPLLSSVIGKRYFIPLSATYSMRMQSNFHRKWIMHLNPAWGL